MSDDLKPFMSAREIRVIEEHLDNQHVMLEWGSGGSTIYFSQRVRAYYSIEHDQEWYAKVQARARQLGLGNLTCSLVPPNLPLDGVPNFARPAEERYEQFRDYIEHVDTFGVPRFDRILIDGRSRPECAVKIAPSLDRESVVFIHDYFNTRYDREAYHSTVESHYEVIGSVREGQSLVVLRPLAAVSGAS